MSRRSLLPALGLVLCGVQSAAADPVTPTLSTTPPAASGRSTTNKQPDTKPEKNSRAKGSLQTQVTGKQEEHGLIAIEGGPGGTCGIWAIDFLKSEKPELNKQLRLAMYFSNLNKDLVGHTMYYSAVCEQKPAGASCPVHDEWLTLHYPESSSGQLIGSTIYKWGTYRIRLTYNPDLSKNVAASEGTPFVDLSSCAAKNLKIEFTIPEPT